MKIEDLSSGKKIDRTVFKNTIKGVLHNIAPEVYGDINAYKHLKALIFSKNKKTPEKEYLLKQVELCFLKYYKVQEVKEIIAFFNGMREVVRQNNINDEAELDRWMEMKKMKQRKKIFGDREKENIQLVSAWP